ncbi:MAG: hypothetical protein Q8Q11_01380 [bacterium]|nr:hypothetical protein [bacterium]MDZ4248283.1 hypothetical protein [Patescibacteria group bacterium]
MSQARKMKLEIDGQEQRLLLDALYHAIDPSFPIGPQGSRAWKEETKERRLYRLYQKVGTFDFE